MYVAEATTRQYESGAGANRRAMLHVDGDRLKSHRLDELRMQTIGQRQVQVGNSTRTTVPSFHDLNLKLLAMVSVGTVGIAFGFFQAMIVMCML